MWFLEAEFEAPGTVGSSSKLTRFGIEVKCDFWKQLSPFSYFFLEKGRGREINELIRETGAIVVRAKI